MKKLIVVFVLFWTLAVTVDWYPKCGIVLGILFPITISSGIIYIIYFIKKK